MRQTFSHFWRICNAVRVTQGLNNFIERLKSEEAVETSELRDFVHVLDRRSLTGTDAHGDNVRVYSTVHNTAFVHRFYNATNRSNRASGKELITALLVLSA